MCDNCLTRVAGQNVGPYLPLPLRSDVHTTQDRMPTRGKLEALRKYQVLIQRPHVTRDACCDDEA